MVPAMTGLGSRHASVVIYGDCGIGKAMIMKRFRDEPPTGFNHMTGTLKTPVLAMENDRLPRGERRFCTERLTLLGAPQRPCGDIAQMEQQHCGPWKRSACRCW